MASHLVVVSGGPGSGKTTLLTELSRRGYLVAPEVARQIIQEQSRNGGTSLPWQDREAYTRLMLERSIQSFELYESVTETVFCDRGIPDTLGYARLIDLADRKAIEAACAEYRYAAVVFLAPPWKAIYQNDNERKQDFAEAERTFRVVETVYRESGYETRVLPLAPPAIRADFVLTHLPIT